MEIEAKKLIIALDDPDFSKAMRTVELTKGYASTFKIGLALYYAHGRRIVEALHDAGVNIFLDLKLCDIPMQVGKATERLTTLGVRFLTVHALGGIQMLRAANQAASGTSTKIVAVSLLTSLSPQHFNEVGLIGTLDQTVVKLCKIAYSAGIRGFVSSPKEVSLLKRHLGQDCLVFCPGIRKPNEVQGDQIRTGGPGEAIKDGADALIIGRPITAAANMADAARTIYQEIGRALSGTMVQAL